MIYLGNGESAFGGLGALHRSRDRGQTWQTLPLPLAPNGTIWNLATHAADPDFLLASTVNGELLQHRCGRFLEQVCQGIWRGARPHLGAELAFGHSARGRTPRLHPRRRSFGLRQSPYAQCAAILDRIGAVPGRRTDRSPTSGRPNRASGTAARISVDRSSSRPPLCGRR